MQPQFVLVFFYLVATTISFLPRIVTKIENQYVQFTCTARGFPRPKVIWKKGRNDISGQETFSNSNMSVTSNFTICRVEKSDAGDYICVASNQVKTVIRKVGLSVQVINPISA